MSDIIIAIFARESLLKSQAVRDAKMATEAAIYATRIKVSEIRFILYSSPDDPEVRAELDGAGCVVILTDEGAPVVLPKIKKLIAVRAVKGEPPIVVLRTSGDAEIVYKYPSNVDDAYHLALNIKDFFDRKRQ